MVSATHHCPETTFGIGFDFSGATAWTSSRLCNSAPALVVVTLALVQWVKNLGVTARGLQVASLGIGLVLGLLYRAATVPPIDFAEWVFAGFFGLALGLVASGVYDLGVNFAARSAGNGGK